MTVDPVRIAGIGAGLIGRRHAEHVLAEPEAMLDAVVNPADAAQGFAAERGADWYSDLTAMLAAGRTPDAEIVSMPNRLRVRNGRECVAAGLPCIVEKPIAHALDGTERLPAAAEGRRRSMPRSGS